MLAYILYQICFKLFWITKRDNKRITNRGRFQGLQIGERGITNRGSLRDFKQGRKANKSGQGFQIGAKRFQIGSEITNQGKRDYKPGQEFQIGAGITNRCRTQVTRNYLYQERRMKHLSLILTVFYITKIHSIRIRAVL